MRLDVRLALLGSLTLLACGDPAPNPTDGGRTGTDSGSELPDASEPVGDSGPPVDSGPQPDGGLNACHPARRLWFADFEAGDYRRWTGMTYGGNWGNDCQSNGFSTDYAVSGTHSHRSEITCSYPQSHRGYGGVQFNGDEVSPGFTNSGQGIVAPHGIVNTFWSRLSAPYEFENGRWFSLWTVNGSCDWSDTVITLGFQDDSRRLNSAHIPSTGGTITLVPGAPTFPRDQWVRTTIYLNWSEGEMHVWQDGQKVMAASFSRPTPGICHLHWGAYANGGNDDVVLYEDDLSVWRLEAPWTDLDREPWFDGDVAACD